MDKYTTEEQEKFRQQIKRANAELVKRGVTVHPRILQARKEGKNV